MNYLLVGVLLAEEPNRGPDYGKASPVGLLVLLLLLVAAFLLWRSMSRQLKKVPASFDTQASDAPEAAESGSPSDESAPAAAPEAGGPDAAATREAGGPDSGAAPRGAGG